MDRVLENEMVKIAEREIEKFAKEWMVTPYAWESETDVHAEIYMRIKLSLRKKFPLGKYKYKGMRREEFFDWVYCKPKTYIKGANYPDLVIYKDTGMRRNVGDRENDPMLWVCEIKYITEWSSLLSKESVENDIKKLKYLLGRKEGGTDYACYMILRRHIPLSESIDKILQRIYKKIHLYHYSV